MNKKWNEKTVLEKALDIISGVALCVWLIFEMMERANTVKYAQMVTYMAVCVICVCQAFSFWKEKRIFSYIAVAGIILMVTVMVLKVL